MFSKLHNNCLDKTNNSTSDDSSNESSESSDESENGSKTATAPYSINLQYDIYLQLSNENVKKKISSFLKKNVVKNQIELIKLENLTWPSSYELAQFSSKCYNKDNGTNLPQGWKILTTASNNNNGYYALAYWNPKRHQIVIAHRGAKNSQDVPIQTHLQAIFERYYSQIQSACTFAYEIIKILEEVKDMAQARFQLFFTGHSLGGWLAQITSFSVKYLTKDKGTRDVFLKIENTDDGYHAHTEVFDSVGCQDILQKMVDDFDVRYEGKTLDLNQLDITNYLLSPNIINCFKKQIGQVVLILSNKEVSLHNHYYPIDDSLELILHTLSDSSCNMDQVTDWPVNDALPIGDESQSLFIPQLKWLNNVNPNTKTKAFIYAQRQCQGYYPIRYQTKPLNKHKHNLNVFTISEQQFLKHFQWMRGVPEYFKLNQLLSNHVGEIEGNIILSKLMSMEVKIKMVKCEQYLIPFVKKLLELFPSLKDEVQKALSIEEVRNFAYKNESNEYCKTLSRLMVHFSKKSSLSKDLKKFLKDDKMQFCQILSNNETEVVTALTNKIMVTHGLNNYLITRFQNILALAKSVSLKEVLKSKEFHQMTLVFDCNVEDDDESEEFFKDIVEFLNSSNTKFKGKILVISQDGSQLSSYLTKLILKKIKCNKILKYEGVKWTDLRTTSQDELIFKHLLVFQGSLERINLKSLLNGAIITNEVIDSDAIISLMKGREIIMGNEVPNLGEIKNYYIPRVFQLHLRLKKDILYNDKNFEEIIAISGEDICPNNLELYFDVKSKFVQICDKDYDINNGRIFILSKENTNDSYESIIKLAGTRNVHWLTLNFNILIWKRTHGCPKYVQRFLDNDDGAIDVLQNLYLNGGIVKHMNNSWNENEIECIINNLKFFVISDTAGMGKTTVLTSLAIKIKLANPNLWVVRINLNDCTKCLKNMSINFISFRIDDAVNFLVDKLMNSNSSTRLKTTFEKHIFKKKLLDIGDVVLLFDAFDEISPNYEDVFEKLLNALKETKVRNIFVTTRPFTRENVELDLNTHSFEMRPFSNEDKLKFLVDYWSFNGNTKTPEELRHKADKLVDVFTNSILDDELKFTGIPLQCRLLAEVYQDSDINDISNNISLVNLYEAFETKMLEIYQKEKCPSTGGSINFEDSEELARKQLHRFHRLLALSIEFDDYSSFPLEKEVLEPEIIKILAKKSLKVGLVLKLGKYPHFVHRTFGEYFVANYFANALEKRNIPEDIVRVIMGDILIGIKFDVIRSFFNGSLNVLKDYGRAVDNFGSAFSKIYLSNVNSWLSELTGNTAFHTAIQYNLKYLFKFLVDCCLTESRVDTIGYFVNAVNLGFQTPTVFALEINNTDSLGLVKYLIEKIKASSEVVQRVYILGNIMNRKCQQRFMDYIEIDQVLGPIALKIRETFYLTDELFDAAERGHVGDLRKILQDAGDEHTRHFLMLAFKNSFASGLNIAVWNGRLDAARYLMDEVPSALPFLFSRPYDSLVQDSIDSDSVELLKLVVKKIKPDSYMLRDWSTMGEMIENGQDEMFSVLLDVGLDTTTVVEMIYGYESLLEYAVRMGNVKIVKSILNRGVDVNSRYSIDGRTPLHRSVFSEHPGSVILLLQHGANLEARDNRGDTALHEAGMNTPGISPRIVSALIEHGSKLDSLNKHNQTPFDVAKSMENTGALIALLPLQPIVTTLDTETRNYLWYKSLQVKNINISVPGDCAAILNEQFTTHEIYFDYFASEFLVNRLQSIEITDDAVVKLMIEVMFKEEYETMKLFLNQLLKRGMYGNKVLQRIGYLMNRNIESNELLHRLVGEYQNNILSFILDCFKGTCTFVSLMTTLDNTSRTALSLAMDAEYYELVDIMLSSLEHCTNSEKSLILEATLYQDNVVIKRLDSLIKNMKNYPFLQNTRSEFQTIREILLKFKNAAIHGRLEELKSCMETVDKIRLEEQKACTATVDTIRKNILSSIEETRDFCKINFHQRTYYNALNLAVDHGQVNVVRVLLEAGFPLNPPYSDEKYDFENYYFYTRKILIPPVFNSVKSGNLSMLKLLIEMGANPNSYYTYWTLLKAAVNYKDIDIVDFLLKSNSSKKIEGLDDSLLVASEKGYTNILSKLLTAGANVNHVDANEYTPLHYVSSYKDENAVSFLLEKGADVNAKHYRGDIALHIAAEKSSAKIVNLLLNKGSEVNAANNNGDTPLHFSVSENSLDVVACLVGRGADWKILNNKNQSPLDEAKRMKRTKIIQFLECSKH